MTQSNASINKIFNRNLVRARRNRAAQDFGAFDFLLRRCEEDFIDRLETISPERRAIGFDKVLDLSCHNGSGARILEAVEGLNPSLFVQGDLSEKMVRAAQTREPGAITLVLDEEWIPFAEESFDLILAPLTLHFVNDLPGALVQIRRILKPGGIFLTSLFGGETLTELRQVLSRAEIEVEGGLSPRVIPFTDVKDFGALMQRVGFCEPVSDLDKLTVTYPNLSGLARDLRGMGLANPMTERRREPMRRETFKEASSVYEKEFGAVGELKASFHILFGTGWAEEA